MASTDDFPCIFILSTRIPQETRYDLESNLSSLTYDISEAEVVVGNISRKERALFELRRLKVALEPDPEPDPEPESTNKDGEERAPKKLKPPGDGTIRVVKLSWLTQSLVKGHPLPFDDYLVYEGTRATGVPVLAPPCPAPLVIQSRKRKLATTQDSRTLTPTSSSNTTPPVPEYLRTVYSCQRPTPANPPNAAFVKLLRAVRTKRRLEKDEVGVRAYSTAIATLSAYPYYLKSVREVDRLPGLGSRISELYREWLESGKLSEAEALKANPELACLKLFDSIWGVGETSAREFYAKGWREIDDIVEFGWTSLTRWQQVGIKFHDEFQTPIAKAESEEIGRLILEHANKYREGFQMVICGGYRKGKPECHDVDVMLSHPDEEATCDAIDPIVAKLEESHLVSHILSIKTDNSRRGQKPTPWKGGTIGLGAGFDSLDKAMLVWHDVRPRRDAGAREQRPLELHRRVDIIITPWRTKGCALLGWSADTTFERDLRRYCKTELGLKFDSSGIRSRRDGKRVDYEIDENGGYAEDMEAAEKMVFKGLGLTFRKPEDRCTG